MDAEDMTRQELIDALRTTGEGGFPASDTADSGEVVLEPELEQAEDAEPVRNAAEEAEHLERRTERTDTPMHPESPPKPERPGA